MRQVLSSLLVIAGLVSGQAIAAPESPPHADIRDSGFVYCVSGQVNTFNPSKASSGLIVDTLAAQFYDRLLDVDPYTYLPKAGKYSTTARPIASTCVAMFRFKKPTGLLPLVK